MQKLRFLSFYVHPKQTYENYDSNTASFIIAVVLRLTSEVRSFLPEFYFMQWYKILDSRTANIIR